MKKPWDIEIFFPDEGGMPKRCQGILNNVRETIRAKENWGNVRGHQVFFPCDDGGFQVNVKETLKDIRQCLG
jgi:hypothetical protein